MPTKLALPLLVVLPDKPGDSVTPITAGYTTYTCECGESYVDNLVDALGHNYVQSGNVYTCTRCGDSYTGHEHSYTEETTEPTCTMAGYTIYTCSCGDSYRVELPALGHDYVLVGQSGMVATYQCSRCHHTYSVVVPIDPNPPVEYSLRSSNTTATTEHHEYIYASGKLLREMITTTDAEGNASTQTLDFTYDTSGNPYSLTYNDTTYYYVVNLQGDVMRLVSGNGATVAEYRYGPYGEVLTASGAIAEVNPLRYRGYYYDAESEFYYLQSRYYDPVVCRFVNADAYASTGQGFIGCNMFAYCLNNPIKYADKVGFYGEVIELGNGWYCRIHPANMNTGVKRHIHIWNSRNSKQSYSQNDDGSPHDKGGNKQGKLPSKVQKALKEKTGWDYNGKRESFYNSTRIISDAIISDANVTIFHYADGAVSYQFRSYFGITPLPIYLGIDALESYYWSANSNSIGNAVPEGMIIVPPFYGPVTLPVPSFGFCPVPTFALI